MRWLPYETFTLDLPQSPAEAAAQLATIVEPKKYFRFGKKHTIFEGDVDQREFYLQRIISGRNSFLPLLNGTFEAMPNGTRVKISFVANPAAIAFMTVWLGGALLGGIAAIAGVITQGRPVWGLLFFPPFIAFGYGLMMSGFRPEVVKAKDLLIDIWQVAPKLTTAVASSLPTS
jgi:hypothetical protein